MLNRLNTAYLIFDIRTNLDKNIEIFGLFLEAESS